MTGVRNPSVGPKRSMRCAGEACRTAQPFPWKRGTVLRSDKWRHDRVIEDMQDNDVQLRGQYRTCSTAPWVQSFPGDVRRVGVRVQRTRVKGGGIPDGAIYVGRGSKWGNPYKLAAYAIEGLTGADLKRERAAMAVRDFEHALHTGCLFFRDVDVVRELRGRDLACWCPLDAKDCHASVLIEVAANQPIDWSKSE